MCFNTFNDAMLESRGTTKTALAPSHSSNQFITSMSFCRSIFCACSLVWVKLSAKQLRGFCTGRSPFGCGKLPLQLIFSEFDMLWNHPFKGIENKMAQSQNQVQSLPQQNVLRILQWRRNTCSRQKSWRYNLIRGIKTSNAQSGQKEPRKAKLFQEAQFGKKKHCHKVHKQLTKKPASTEWGIHSSPTWMIAWPPNFNKAFIASILTVLPCICWGGDLESPRLMEASSSSLLHLPSCR